MTNIKKFFGLIWTYLRYTHIGRILGGAFLMIFGLGMTNFCDEDSTANTIFTYIGFFGVSVLVVYTLIFIAYGWIINPIRDWKENKKNKK